MTDETERRELSDRLTRFRSVLLGVENGELSKEEYTPQALGKLLTDALADSINSAPEKSTYSDARYRNNLMLCAQKLCRGEQVEVSRLYAGLRGLIIESPHSEEKRESYERRESRLRTVEDVCVVMLTQGRCLITLKCPPDACGVYISFLADGGNGTFYSKEEFEATGVVCDAPEFWRYVYIRAAFQSGDESDAVIFDSYLARYGIDVTLGVMAGEVFIAHAVAGGTRIQPVVRVRGRKDITLPAMTAVLADDMGIGAAYAGNTVASFMPRSLSTGAAYYRLGVIKRSGTWLSVIFRPDGCRPIMRSWEV